MNKILTLLLILISFTFGQSGGKSFDKYMDNLTLMVGMNQSFYSEEWNDMLEDTDSDVTIDQNPFRKLNFGLINEFDHGVLGGVKYLSYGYDIDSEVSDSEYNDYEGYSSDLSLELKFLKLFLTYPVSNGLYLGVEGGYFMEGEYKFKATGGYNDNENTDIDREMWTEDLDFSEFDYGLLGQFYYNINEDLLVSVEGYYGLSKYKEDMDVSLSSVPNVFNYVNLGIAYKLGKKSK